MAPRWAAWQPSTPYTVGLEEEVMLLDPGTWTLAQRAHRLLGVLGDDLVDSCSAETHEAALELSTGPHATVGGAVAELRQLRARLARDAHTVGLAVAAAGMHPGEMTDDPRSRRPGATRSCRTPCAGSPAASRPSPCTCTSAWRTRTARSGC